MAASEGDLAPLQPPSALFTGIKFFVTGEIPDQIVDLLKNGGGERLNYFSDYVTHLICGANPEENDVTDANDLYEIPAVTAKWVILCVRLGRILATRPFSYNAKKLFSQMVFCLSRLGRDLEPLWAVITYHGGVVQLNFNNNCTHLVTTDTNSDKYDRAVKMGCEKVAVVTPDWVMECVRNKTLLQFDLFHPKRVQWPEVVKHESTTSITGFEPEKVEAIESNDSIADSTQALLEKLKQRMPWNQQVTTSDVAPPNVVAPSFLNKNQPIRAFNQVQNNFVQPNQQVPRSIVHHTPQPQQLLQQQANFNIPNQANVNRLMGQQNRPPLQQLQNQNQLHQQLMQQRARGLTLQQQQLLQQQLSQGQARQLIQNQSVQQILGQNQQLNQMLQTNSQTQVQAQNQQLVQAQNQQLVQAQNQQFVQSPQVLQQKNQLLQQNQILMQQQNQQVMPQNQLLLQNQILQQKQIFTQPNPQNLVIQQQQFVGNNNQQQQFPQNQEHFQQNNQFLLNQQQNFNQQPRPQINQQIWQQQQQSQQITVRHPVNMTNQQQGPRVQWSPTQQQPNQVPQRQYIQLDAQTHNQLQKMPPEQQALFVARLQRQKQLLMQKQLQQRGGGHILIRGSVPPGLNPQQQMQWLQQQAKQQGVVLPPNIQQQTITPGTITPQAVPAQGIQHAPGLSPIQQQQQPQFADQNQQQQIQLRNYKLQQLQREQAQKNQLAQAQQGALQAGVVRPLANVVADSSTNPVAQEGGVPQQPLVVNAKTKTALANMLSIRLQSGAASVGPGQEAIPEPSAAGTLRLMTQQHNAALNPNSRPQDLLSLQQRRIINGPNGEIIRPPVPQVVPATPQTDPPKLQFSPRAPTAPLQHRPGPFYGHNPNLKLPPDLFLLGCIFVVVEIEGDLEESCPRWQQKIEKHGGEVEKQYCSRVTHVLCETQRHGVVMQALRDCKRCVTIHWLNDVMSRKQVLPPWAALHLPKIYLDTTPAAKHLIAMCGFDGSDRHKVRDMIKYTGAKFTSYFSKHNTMLIAAKTEGTKYGRAKKWGTPVVNVQWLTDVMLGNFTAMNQMEHLMYQQFPFPPNFSFDPKLVPNLMHAWKMPINISQESYERVKRSASPVLLPKALKKPKVEQTDENDNVNDEMTVSNFTHRILFSMSSNLDAMTQIVKQLGGHLAKSHQDCTHLVMPSLARTNKLLFCVVQGCHIVSEQWLRDSHSSQKFLDESNYSLDTKDFNSEYKCDLSQTLSTKNRNRLFEGKFFWITPSVFPSKRVLTELIQGCGGVVERIRRSSAQIEATNVNAPYSYVIITHENDIHLVADLLKNKKDKIRVVCCAELIFSAILRQTFEVEPFAVKVI